MIGGITLSSRQFHDLKSVAMKLEKCQTSFKSNRVINSKITAVLKNDLDM